MSYCDKLLLTIRANNIEPTNAQQLTFLIIIK